jgi:hypothetical protein
MRQRIHHSKAVRVRCLGILISHTRTQRARHMDVGSGAGSGCQIGHHVRKLRIG